MEILIGGSPSTGSSLLRQMLNRHPQIYCGPETRLFTFPVLFEKWHVAKRGVARGGLLPRAVLKAPSVYMIHGPRLVSKEHCWNRADLQRLVRSAHDIRSFARQYFARPCTEYGKAHWAEKTPENVLTFELFTAQWQDAHLIHMVRDPRDAIASLMARGHTLFSAVARYVFNTAFGMKNRDHIAYREVSYEDLVRDPKGTLTKLLLGFGLQFDRDMLKPGNPNMTETSKMPGWRSSETGVPRPDSIGRFGDLPEQVQQRAIAAMHLMRIEPQFGVEHGLDYLHIPRLAKTLGYDLPAPRPDHLGPARKTLIRQLMRHRWKRLRSFDWFFERNRPIQITAVHEFEI